MAKQVAKVTDDEPAEFQPGSYLGIPQPRQKATIIPSFNWDRISKVLPTFSKGLGAFLLFVGIDAIWFLFIYGIECMNVDSNNKGHPDDQWSYPSLNPLDHPIWMFFTLAINVIILGVILVDPD